MRLYVIFLSILAVLIFSELAKASPKVENLIRKIFYDDSDRAVCIVRHESNFRPGAIGDGGSSLGLFQIHLPAHPFLNRRLLLTSEYNIRAARQIYINAGHSWQPWSTHNLCGG